MRQIDGYPLWLGTARDARDLRAVLDAGIEAVVDLAMEELPVPPSRELVYLRFPLADGFGNPPWLLRAAVDAVAGLVREGAWTLVACGGGVSRSPAVAAFALAKHESGAADKVLDRMTADAPLDVSPGLWVSLRIRSEGVTRVGQPDAMRIAEAFLAGCGFRVVPSLSGYPWHERPRLCALDSCHLIDTGRPGWSVLFKSQRPNGAGHVDGPVVLVDAETGTAEFPTSGRV